MDTNFKQHAAEAFNTIRTNLSFLNVDSELKKIMVTSSIKGEGKSTISSNIAYALSSNKKVIIIDCDLRNHTTHKMFSVPNRKGLSDLILSNKQDEDDLDCIINFTKNLDILTAGHRPPNPTELLASNRMERIFNQLSPYYDYIILDTPPILVVPDALALYKNVDGLLLVTRHGYTTKEVLETAKTTLEVANAKITACIFNAIPDIEKKYSYYGYYEYNSTESENSKSDNRKKSKGSPTTRAGAIKRSTSNSKSKVTEMKKAEDERFSEKNKRINSEENLEFAYIEDEKITFESKQTYDSKFDETKKVDISAVNKEVNVAKRELTNNDKQNRRKLQP